MKLVRYVNMPFVILGTFLTLVMAIAPCVQAAPAPTLGPIVNLSHDPGLSTEPIVGSVGANVYVAWEDSSNGRPQLYFVKSADGGATWGTITQFRAIGSASSVQIAATDQYVFLVWKQGAQAAFAASSDFGVTFAPMKTFPVANGAASEPTIATNGSKGVYLLWNFFSSTNGSGYAIFAASHDGGNTFTAPRMISGNTPVRELQMAVQGSYIYIVWPSIFYVRSTDGGQTFSRVMNLRDPLCTGSCLSREPMIATSGNNVYVTWPSTLGGSYQGYIAVSHDNGATWTRTVIFSRLDVNNTREIQVAACSGSNTQVPCSSTTNVYVTARVIGPGGGTANQWVVVSNDSGTSFSKPFDLAVQSKGHIGFGGIGVDGSNVIVFWGHQAPKGGIGQMWVKESQDQGHTWAGVQQVSASTGGVIGLNDATGQHDQGPIVSAGAGNVYMVWQDNSSGNGDVYFRAGTG